MQDVGPLVKKGWLHSVSAHCWWHCHRVNHRLLLFQRSHGTSELFRRYCWMYSHCRACPELACHWSSHLACSDADHNHSCRSSAYCPPFTLQRRKIMPLISVLLTGVGILLMLLVLILLLSKRPTPSKLPTCSECWQATNDLREYIWTIGSRGRARGMLCSDCAGRLQANQIGWKQVYPR